MKLNEVEYNLYVNKGADKFLLKEIEDFVKDVKLELKYFIEKDEILQKISNNMTIEELEYIIDEINDKNKNNISYFIISKEDEYYLNKIK